MSDFGIMDPSNFSANRELPSNQLKRDRDTFEDEQMHIQTAVQSRIHFTRVKDIGTRLKREDQQEQRNKNIIEKAADKPLPSGSWLSSRASYWFVTTEDVQLSYEDAALFVWQDRKVAVKGQQVYFLNLVDFAKDRNGTIWFQFPDGTYERVECYSKSKKYPASKKVKLSSSASHDSMQIENESQSAAPSALGTPQDYGQGNNTNRTNPIDTPSSSIGQSPSSSSSIVDLAMLEQHIQGLPQPLSNGNTLPPGAALIVNILLLVPDKPKHLQMVEQVLVELEFEKEASCTHQSLFKKKLSNITRHVLVFPYAKPSSLYVIKDYVPQASEIILLLESEAEQTNNFMVISRINNIPNINSEVKDSWTLKCKTMNFKAVELDYSTLSQSVKQLLAIGELKDVVLGGTTWKKSIDGNELTESFMSYFLEWTLAVVERHSVQNIYICFKFKDEKVKAFTSFASSVLKALDIEYEEAVTVHGSVLVYFRCPSYITWYILQRKDRIFEALRKDGLTEIYECFVSDVEASMGRDENKEFMHELTHLREQMISDNIAEKPTHNRFRVLDSMEAMKWALKAIASVSNTIVNAVAPEAVVTNDIEDLINKVDNVSISEAESVPHIGPIECPPTIDKLPADKRKVLDEKYAELKTFDHRWTKTVAECYDSDKLRQQLFNFKTDKNAKIAVRVFLASTSAGLATNVAKLMRPFGGKTIIDGVHSGLQIANTIIEWNQSGIVHIGELKYGNAVAVLFDVQESVKIDFNEETAKKMINFIQKWNIERQYSTEEFNSHRFVRDFLQYTMGVSLLDRFKGPLGSYMDYVMRTGDVTPRLISKTHGTMVFKTHKELEDADRDMRTKLSDDELKLLKIFHRGFQLKEAASGKDVSSCCYGLPTTGLEMLNDSGKPMNMSN